MYVGIKHNRLGPKQYIRKVKSCKIKHVKEFFYIEFVDVLSKFKTDGQQYNHIYSFSFLV